VSEERAAGAIAVIERVTAALAEADEWLAAAGVKRPAPPFSLTRNRIVVTSDQAREFARSGRIRIYEFGWPILARDVPRWDREAADLIASLRADVAVSAPGGTGPCLDEAVRTRDWLRESVDRSRFFVDRTRSWDGFCRTGPWLTDRATKVELERQMDDLARLPGGGGEALRQKRMVYDHYYRMRREAKAVSLERGAGGYCLSVRLVLWGRGADAAAVARVAAAVESWWQGEVDGVRFATRADVRLDRAGPKPPHHRIEFAAPGEVFMPSTERFHHGVEPETIAHEVGHVLGFADRYRDLLDAERGVYVDYLEDIQSLMAAQNLIAPVVTDSDLRDLVYTYLDADFGGIRP
jgi:hypothetical protein